MCEPPSVQIECPDEWVKAQLETPMVPEILKKNRGCATLHPLAVVELTNSGGKSSIPLARFGASSKHLTIIIIIMFEI